MAKTLFVKNWLFKKYDIDAPIMDLIDSDEFFPVDIPHDWMISQVNNLYESSIGVYKKNWNITPVPSHNYILRFEGVYQDCTVLVNKTVVQEWKYGYSTFEADITTAIHSGDNEICVIVKYEAPNTRWYSGAGIYRNVYLLEKDSCYLPSDGCYVSTKKCGSNYMMNIDTEVFLLDTCNAKVTHILTDAEGKTIASVTVTLPKNGGIQKVSCEKEVITPVEWDIDNPYLYTLTSTLYIDSNEVDQEVTNIGFRTISFDPDHGFFLNGRRVQINGVCQHHDLGALGAAVNRVATRRQLELLKKMGVNSVRTSHNMPSVELMELADEMGILICSEAFDMWENKKTPYDYSNHFPTWYKKDVASWIRRDRNHPSVIMWSIGNEVTDTNEDKGLTWTRLLRDEVRSHDCNHNAYIGIGSNYVEWEPAQRCSDELELSGYNYGERLYDEHHKKYPNWCIFGSETSSTVQSRGIYHFPYEKVILTHTDGQCSSLGNCTTNWGARNTDTVVANHRDREFVAGQYLWSGFDYIGEPTPFFSKNSFFGQLDTAGFEKDTYYHYQAEWTDYRTSPMVHLLPYWDFNEGQIIDVCAYSNAPYVELFFNGESLGRQFIDHAHGTDLQGRWKVPYHKGELKAVATDEEGNVIATDIQRSFGDAAKICLSAGKDTLIANGEDLIFLTITTVDADGNYVANARNRVNVNVTGAGRLIGLDNGDSTDYDEYKGTSRRLFSGKLLAIIAATDKTGAIDVTVTSDGLISEHLCLTALPTDKPINVCHGYFVPTSQDVHDIPVRKIELTKVNNDECPDNVLNAEHPDIYLKYKMLPENATYSDIVVRALTKDAVDANYIKVTIENDATTQQPLIHVQAIGDGEFRLTAFCNNGKEHPEIVSDLEFRAEGLGLANHDGYSLVPGIQYDVSSSPDSDLSFDGGVFLPCEGTGHVTYHNVDLGAYGSDEITIPIFSFHDDVDLEVWNGTLENGECLYKGTYHAPTWYNHYQPNTFKLSKRVSGLATITLVFHVYEKLSVQGFYFNRKEKAYSLLNATESDRITGDSFTMASNAVEHIGNNVSIDWDNMDFSATGIGKVEINCKSHNPVTSIHLLFTDGDTQMRHMVEVPYSDEYETFSFDMPDIRMNCSLSVVFLPGTDCDLRSIQFVAME